MMARPYGAIITFMLSVYKMLLSVQIIYVNHFKVLRYDSSTI